MTSETQTTGTETASGASAGDAWRDAIAARKIQPREDQLIPGAQASRPDASLTRRNFIRASFWAGLGATLLGTVGLMVDNLYPRDVKGFGGPVPAGKVTEFPKGGEPKHFLAGQFWLANLDPKETRPGGTGGAAGLLALWHRCPHLGCTVPWRSTFDFEGDAGWYRCPCHGSTYTRAGVRVFGPAPRSMDTMKINIDGAGNIVVQTGQRIKGGPDNPQRAVQHPLLPS